MHAEAPLSWKLVAPEEKSRKIEEKLHILYACRHAKASPAGSQLHLR